MELRTVCSGVFGGIPNTFVLASLVSLCFIPIAPNDAFCQRPTADEGDIGMAYLAQSLEMPRYVARVTGEEDDGEGEKASLSKFEAVYCYCMPDGSKTPNERFERTQLWENWEGKVRDINERVLKTSNHEWIERYGLIFDARTKKPEEDEKDAYTPVQSFDPLFLPISSTLSMRFGWANRDDLSNYMPSGFLHERLTDSLGNDVGVWYRGKPKVIGLQAVHFDPRHGMPVKSVEWIKRRGLKEIDVQNPKVSVELYSTTTTEWKSFKNGDLWLPVSIQSEQVARGRCSYSVRIEWWIDDEVPSQIFELDDFKLASSRASRLNKMIEEREERKENSQRSRTPK